MSRPAADAGTMSGRAWTAILGAGLVILMSSCTGSPPMPPSQTTAPAGSGSTGDLSAVPGIVREVESSVVTIQTSGGIGSGVIYRSDGTIVTDAHVVEDQEKKPSKNVQIRFADGSEAPATVVGVDDATDVAVVKADRGNLPAAKFSTALPQVGQLTVVIGSPLGLEQTVTAGIVSALHRNMPPSEESPQGLIDLIQTDAPISPGNSGGAVVNSSSEIIGLSEAYLPPSSGAVSIGFVTPTATVTDVAEQILKSGSAIHPVLGIVPSDISPEIADRFGLPVASGALVIGVAPGGPAASAGLQPGDIITQFDGQKIASVTDLLAGIRKKDPGQQSVIEFQRGKENKSVTATLGSTAKG
ncbi:trypsin-like peptidase domain-containing protein [Paenarthrobacter sp. AR 02]|uniref:S1C family serine protease n=1 Tax=Paenarthrobacter sp. AR 02 TaxID=2899821 RepID=UPI001F19306D|nr:trypsin-like peptidase domain-containing protein [Paenarthrobacter sp. AR 02]MCF3141386.1 trypsin-like peptidase domain-containing protein [Paenarthrobacter sp. AR 02]